MSISAIDAYNRAKGHKLKARHKYNRLREGDWLLIQSLADHLMAAHLALQPFAKEYEESWHGQGFDPAERPILLAEAELEDGPPDPDDRPLFTVGDLMQAHALLAINGQLRLQPDHHPVHRKAKGRLRVRD